MYPAQSNFTTGARDGWVTFPRGEARVALQVAGLPFVSGVQSRLRSIPANTRTFDGTISGSEITTDGKVGQKTMRGLWTKLREMNAPQSMLDAVQRSAATNTIDREALRGMAWFFLSQIGVSVPADTVEVPADVVVPVWGRAAPTSAEGPTFTTISTGTPPAPPAPPVDDGGGGGGPKPPVLNPDGSVTVRPRGVPTNDPAPREGTISTGVAVAGVATVVLLIALAVGARRDAKRAAGGGSRSKKRR